MHSSISQKSLKQNILKGLKCSNGYKSNPMNLESIYKDMMLERSCKTEPEGTIIGTCEEFCPKFECIERILRGDVSKYEQQIMFKKYYRSSAGKSKSFPEDMRPINVLLQVTNYLMDLSYNDFTLDVYKFIDNRTRAISLDLSVQSLGCKTAIDILEKITRFYILYYYVLFDNKEFEAHLNQEQIKKILSKLNFMYQKNKIINEEFISYSVLISMDNKFPQYENYLYLPKVRQVYNIRKYYQQGDFYKCFQQARKLDLLSFIVLFMSFDTIRMRAVEVYGKCLVEKLDLTFFNQFLYTSDTEIKSLFDKMNIEVVQGKASFKDADIYETESYLVKERKEQIGLKFPSVLIYLGDIEYRIGQYIVNDYIYQFIRENYNKTVDKKHLLDYRTFQYTKQGNQLENEIFKKLLVELSKNYTTVVFQNIKRAIKDKETKKQLVKNGCFYVLNSFLKSLALEYMKIYQQDQTLRNKIINWTKKCTESEARDSTKPQDDRKNTLAIVLNDSIFSVLLRNTIEKSKLSDFNPVFYSLKNVLPQKLLKFNLSVFSVDKSSKQEINEKFFMLNKIVETPQNLIKMLDSVETRTNQSKLMVRCKLSALLNGKNKNKQIFIVTQLIESGKNTRELEDILIQIGNGNRFKDIDVYLEEGQSF